MNTFLADKLPLIFSEQGQIKPVASILIYLMCVCTAPQFVLSVLDSLGWYHFPDVEATGFFGHAWMLLFSGLGLYLLPKHSAWFTAPPRFARPLYWVVTGMFFLLFLSLATYAANNEYLPWLG